MKKLKMPSQKTIENLLEIYKYLKKHIPFNLNFEKFLLKMVSDDQFKTKILLWYSRLKAEKGQNETNHN